MYSSPSAKLRISWSCAGEAAEAASRGNAATTAPAGRERPAGKHCSHDELCARRPAHVVAAVRKDRWPQLVGHVKHPGARGTHPS